jgi:predicted alpha/beta-fold hydrolase
MATVYEEKINWRMDGYKSIEEYREKVSSKNYIKGIKIPTFFYFSLDDPLISTNSIDFEGLKKNENIIFGHTEYGSHLSTFSSLTSKQ